MKKLLLAAALVAWPLMAFAQSAQVLSGGCGTAGYANTKGGAPSTQDTLGQGCVSVAPGPTRSEGTITVGNTSTALTAGNVTTSAGMPAWASLMPAAYVCVSNQTASPSTAYFCIGGGTCTAGTGSNGLDIAPGASRCRGVPAGMTPTVISDGTSYLGLTQ